MSLRVLVYGESEAIEEGLISILRKIGSGDLAVEWERFHDHGREGARFHAGSILLVDARLRDLEKTLSETNPGLCPVVLIGEESQVLTALQGGGAVDDVIVFPIRQVELISQLRILQELSALREAVSMGSSLAEVVQRFKEDLQVVEKLQKLNSRGLATEMGEFLVTSRYVSGLEPGGDSYEILQPKGSLDLACILTHSSNYGLRSRVNSYINKEVLPYFLKAESFRLGSDEAGLSQKVHQWCEGIKILLRESEYLSLFVAVLDQKSKCLATIHFGHCLTYLASASGEFEYLAPQAPVLSRNMGAENLALKLVTQDFGPTGRLVLFSPGVKRILGKDKVADLMAIGKKTDALDLSREMLYLVREASLATQQEHPEEESSGGGTDISLPVQDCSALIIERKLRVEKIG